MRELPTQSLSLFPFSPLSPPFRHGPFPVPLPGPVAYSPPPPLFTPLLFPSSSPPLSARRPQRASAAKRD
jgi:hypothetical protein